VIHHLYTPDLAMGQKLTEKQSNAISTKL